MVQNRIWTLAILLTLGLGAIAVADHWPRFRGPNGAGVSDAKGIPTSWTESEYAWNVELPGIGHSSPVVWGDKLFVLSADPRNATRYVLCLDANSGKEIWRRSYASQSHHLHARNSFASCSPAVDEDRVYFAWGTPEKTTLQALTHDGKDVWEIELPAFVAMHGFGTSPMVYKDLVVLNMLALESPEQIKKVQDYKEPGNAFLVAVDRETGEQRWRSDRDSSVDE